MARLRRYSECDAASEFAAEVRAAPEQVPGGNQLVGSTKLLSAERSEVPKARYPVLQQNQEGQRNPSEADSIRGRAPVASEEELHRVLRRNFGRLLEARQDAHVDERLGGDSLLDEEGNQLHGLRWYRRLHAQSRPSDLLQVLLPGQQHHQLKEHHRFPEDSGRRSASPSKPNRPRVR